MGRRSGDVEAVVLVALSLLPVWSPRKGAGPPRWERVFLSCRPGGGLDIAPLHAEDGVCALYFLLLSLLLLFLGMMTMVMMMRMLADIVLILLLPSCYDGSPIAIE